MNRIQLINEAVSLPIEERAMVVESLLSSFNQPESEIDQLWIQEAQRRLSELTSDETKAIAGKDVFEKVLNRFGK